MSGERLQLLLIFTLTVSLGIPVWYYSTKIYRASIPHDKITALSQETIMHWPITIELACDDSTLTKHITALKSALDGRFNSSATRQSPYKINISTRDIPSDVLNRLHGAKNANEIDSILSSSKLSSKNGIYTFAILSSTASAETSGKWTAGSSRWFWTSVTPSTPRATLEQSLIDIIETKLLSPAVRKDVTVAPSSEFQVAITLLNGNMEKPILSWNWDKVHRQIAQFAETAKPLCSIAVTSQIVNYASLKHRPPHFDAKKKEYFYTPMELAHFVDANDWRLESSGTNASTINLLVYIPSPQQSPLRIRNAKGANSETNSFVVPQWGSVYIHSDASQVGSADQAMEHAVPVFIAQLRELIGFSTLQDSGSLHMVPSSSGLAVWEMDALLRYRRVANLQTPRNTLEAFAKMIEDLTNIPVNDDVADDIGRVLHSLDDATSKASVQEYEQAYHLSNTAATLAERIFFNERMLAMLYFPDEHTLAVYVPLVVPLCFPLVGGFLAEYRRRKRKSAEAAEREKQNQGNVSEVPKSAHQK